MTLSVICISNITEPILTIAVGNFPLSGSVSFIDYEYADFNYQAFDIANHFNEFAGRQQIHIQYKLHIIEHGEHK